MAIMLVARLMYVTPQTHHHPMAPVSLVTINVVLIFNIVEITIATHC